MFKPTFKLDAHARSVHATSTNIRFFFKRKSNLYIQKVRDNEITKEDQKDVPANSFRPSSKLDTRKSSFHPTFKNIGDFADVYSSKCPSKERRRSMEEEEAMCREAIAACMRCILEHLSGFLKELPNSTYEQWILKLHPDNANDKHHSNIAKIDHRFYVEESDHRLIWNENMDTLATGNVPNRSSFSSRKVQSRYKHGAP